MSNVTKKIRKNMNKPDELYTTLIGSIITSVGMISNKSYIKNKELFKTLKKNKKVLAPYKTVKDLCDYIFTIHGDEAMEKQFQKSLCLCYDEPSLRQPLVCFATEVQDDKGNVYPKLLPLDPKGNMYGVMQAFETGSPNVYIESVYVDDPEEELADTYNEINK